MLARVNGSGEEVSILPTGLGNHYTSGNKHLIPPGRKRIPYNHSMSSISECYVGDPAAPEANMSFREQQEYFGPDVLVIVGLVLASVGATLTLISFYCQFKHPAIQATMAGIGPSLVGIGMLFCILRLFFCTFCISRTCCECIADVIVRCPCFRLMEKNKKQVHPLKVKDNNASKVIKNGHTAMNNYDKAKHNANNYNKTKPNANNYDKTTHNVNNGFANKILNHNESRIIHLFPPEIEMSKRYDQHRNEFEYKKKGISDRGRGQDLVSESNVDIPDGTDEIIERKRDEIDILDELKSNGMGSPESGNLQRSISELVLKSNSRY